MQVPFDKENQLLDLSQHPGAYLPGQPRVSLTSDPQRLLTYLTNELCTKDLDDISPYLWLMSTRSAANVWPLHYQKIKGRDIILTENARLHLLWIDERIFLKPLPPYLLSYDFWRGYILPDDSVKGCQIYHCNKEKEDLARAAMGLLRSYLFLIQYSSDLDIAVQHRLLPAGTTFESFCSFTSRLSCVTDTEVAPRYHYGEIRLARLNVWSKILLQRWNYQTVNWHYRQYFQRFYGPYLFMFGFFSVTLSAVQAEMAVEGVLAQRGLPGQWPVFWAFSRVFSVLSLIMVGLPSLGILAMLVGKPLMELRYALTH